MNLNPASMTIASINSDLSAISNKLANLEKTIQKSYVNEHANVNANTYVPVFKYTQIMQLTSARCIGNTRAIKHIIANDEFDIYAIDATQRTELMILFQYDIRLANKLMTRIIERGLANSSYWNYMSSVNGSLIEIIPDPASLKRFLSEVPGINATSSILRILNRLVDCTVTTVFNLIYSDALVRTIEFCLEYEAFIDKTVIPKMIDQLCKVNTDCIKHGRLLSLISKLCQAQVSM